MGRIARTPKVALPTSCSVSSIACASFASDFLAELRFCGNDLLFRAMKRGMNIASGKQLRQEQSVELHVGDCASDCSDRLAWLVRPQSTGLGRSNIERPSSPSVRPPPVGHRQLPVESRSSRRHGIQRTPGNFPACRGWPCRCNRNKHQGRKLPTKLRPNALASNLPSFASDSRKTKAPSP